MLFNFAHNILCFFKWIIKLNKIGKNRPRLIHMQLFFHISKVNMGLKNRISRK